MSKGNVLFVKSSELLPETSTRQTEKGLVNFLALEFLIFDAVVCSMENLQFYKVLLFV